MQHCYLKLYINPAKNAPGVRSGPTRGGGGGGDLKLYINPAKNAPGVRSGPTRGGGGGGESIAPLYLLLEKT